MKSGYRPSYAALVALLLVSIVGCNTAPKSDEKKDALADEAQAVLKQMQA